MNNWNLYLLVPLHLALLDVNVHTVIRQVYSPLLEIVQSFIFWVYSFSLSFLLEESLWKIMATSISQLQFHLFPNLLISGLQKRSFFFSSNYCKVKAFIIYLVFVRYMSRNCIVSFKKLLSLTSSCFCYVCFYPFLQVLSFSML